MGLKSIFGKSQQTNANRGAWQGQQRKDPTPVPPSVLREVNDAITMTPGQLMVQSENVLHEHNHAIFVDNGRSLAAPRFWQDTNFYFVKVVDLTNECIDALKAIGWEATKTRDTLQYRGFFETVQKARGVA